MAFIFVRNSNKTCIRRIMFSFIKKTQGWWSPKSLKEKYNHLKLILHENIEKYINNGVSGLRNIYDLYVDNFIKTYRIVLSINITYTNNINVFTSRIYLMIDKIRMFSRNISSSKMWMSSLKGMPILWGSSKSMYRCTLQWDSKMW